MLGCRWYDYMSNDLVLRETELRQVTCIVRERQPRPYGCVALPTLVQNDEVLSVPRADPPGFGLLRDLDAETS